MLGDFVYKSKNAVPCSKQIIEAFKETGKTIVSIKEVPLENVVHYGILHGIWNDDEEKIMNVDSMVEKPTDDYAEEYLGVKSRKGTEKYYATFGQYVLTKEVFDELDAEITSGPTEGTEYGLTAALDKVREKYGMVAYKPEGESFDIGLPDSYLYTIRNYSKEG